MATGKISRRRRLVATDLAGENVEVLREIEGEEASAAAEEEVFGRTFIADSQHSTVRFKSQSSVIATINSSNISPIYQSTRIFTVLAMQDKNLWKILNRVEQEISLTYLQTKHFLFCGGGGFFSFTLPNHFCVFSGKIYCNETTAPRDLSGGHGSSFDGESFCRR
ncbi:receptor-like protein kinase THESEUS 1 [Senna tora]|uniref:Receptor-like protein kinase THESEUS 1 n=1 Tax=Senna tora TaxID=362788 RepID=A0A835C4J1_9FABA|nr:receptor-like protein kinase THESEUS 1 [Senna tora]